MFVDVNFALLNDKAMEQMTKTQTSVGDWNDRTRRDLIRLATWTGAWLVTLAVAVFGPELVWQARVPTAVAIALNLVVGIGMIRANVLHLRMLDEMMQRIHLEAAALAVGIGIVGGLSYSAAATTGLIAADAGLGVSVMVVLIGLTYLVAVAVGCRRHR